MQDRSRALDYAVSHTTEPYRSSDTSIVPNGFRPFERPTYSPSRTTKEESKSLGKTTAISDTSDESDDELNETNSSAQDEQRVTQLPSSTLPTGLCYDARMRFHCELDPPKDRSNYHPEDPRRIFHIYRTLCEAGLVKDQMAPQQLVDQPLYRVSARHAKKSEICLVHEERHFDFMESTRDMSEEELVFKEKRFDSIYFNKTTHSSALLSAGGAIDTCLAVVKGIVKNAIAVIRPPGHHAEAERPMGFCLFDNVSIAVKVCQQAYPEKCRKVLIVDWDVHHGNGIQQAFESDPNVLYISIHVHENGTFYPSGPYGDHLHCGQGAGLGKNINIPWPTKGMGDADYLFAFQNIVMPVAYDFDPDLVVIAAGFDAAAGDQLGGCFVTPPCYAHMTHMLTSLANGKLVVCLEGGYNLKSISKSALAVTRTLMGESPDRIEDTVPTKIGVALVKKVLQHQSRFWRCLYPKDINKDIEVIPGAERMHDVVRAYQSKLLYDSHEMINLFIYRQKLSKSFENQVLATPNYAGSLPLLVIFHDPPDILGVPDPITNKLDLHRSWLADVLKQYISWGVKQGFGVIDVNIPKFLTGIDDLQEYAENDQPGRQVAVEELAVYIWENYIECNDATSICFLGVGEAYSAILHLLDTRNDESLSQITGIVNFIAGNPLRRVHDTFVQYLSKWYYSHSINYIENEHMVWSRPREKKLSKGFGKLHRSPVQGLNAMLMNHKLEIQDFLLLKAGLPIRQDSEEGDTIMVAGTASQPVII